MCEGVSIMIFVVNDEPYEIVDFDVKNKNRDFIEGIDAEYFSYILKIHSTSDTDDSNRSYIALRNALHHGMETLFALLGAYLQAHICAYAWIALYKNVELNKLIEKINKNEFVFTRLKINELSWDTLANHIFHCNSSTSNEQKNIAKSFGALWGKLANEYLDANNKNEYNAFKHGFRAQSGSFSLFCGIQEFEGIPSNDMKHVGTSEYGSSIFKLELVNSIKGNRLYKSKVVSSGHSKEKILILLQLVYLSIKNIKLSFKIINGIDIKNEAFIIPKDISIFEQPWNYICSINNLVTDTVIDNQNELFFDKRQLQKKINEYMNKNFGR